MKKQRVQYLINENWLDIPFKDVKTGMIVRIFTKNGEFLKGKRGNTTFKAMSDVYKNKDGKNVFNYMEIIKNKEI